MMILLLGLSLIIDFQTLRDREGGGREDEGDDGVERGGGEKNTFLLEQDRALKKEKEMCRLRCDATRLQLQLQFQYE